MDIEAARPGDRLAVERLLREIQPFVAAICRARLALNNVEALARRLCLTVSSGAS